MYRYPLEPPRRELSNGAWYMPTACPYACLCTCQYMPMYRTDYRDSGTASSKDPNVRSSSIARPKKKRPLGIDAMSKMAAPSVTVTKMSAPSME